MLAFRQKITGGWSFFFEGASAPVVFGLRLILFLLLSLFSFEAFSLERPNILVIVADDLGFADLGSFGGEIHTPNLDALALRGVRLTDFQASSACSPTRAMLLTGVDNHLTGFGNLAEELSPNQKGQPGYEGYLNERVVTIATLLRDAGYHTYISGKWHLGTASDTGPKSRGFERSLVQLAGASHFADMQPSYSPDPAAKAGYLSDDTLIRELPEHFKYSSQFHADNLIEYLEQDKSTGKPFFGILSFTAPHWPLQLPTEKLDMYAGRYDDGYDALYQARWENMVHMGLIDIGTPKPVRPPNLKRWASLDESRRKVESRSMEIYAGMVELMDLHAGRVIDYLEKTDRLDNTLIIFLSDNGAEGHDLDGTWPAEKFPKIRRVIDERFDHSYANMGRPNSYTMYGPGWARAGAPQLRMYKAFSTEGGTRVAAFVTLPGVRKNAEINTSLVSVKDIAPTLLDFAGLERHRGTYGGRTVETMTGRTIRPLLESGEKSNDFDSRELGMELIGKYAYRQGSWKIVVLPAPYGSNDVELYNLTDDPGETNNLAKAHPQRLVDMVNKWHRYADESGVIFPDWLSGY